MPFQRKAICIGLIFILFSGNALAHNLKGTIKNRSGEPIPYATVYVKEVSLGTTTNIDGEFELELPNATFTINFRSLGYIPKTEAIQLGNQVKTMNIVLEEQVQQIQEVKITGSGEDPANAVIRKVIALSYVHLNQINTYLADVYIRGTVKFESIPSIIRNQLKKRNINIKAGDVLVNETMSQIHFKAPDKYDQHIKSINSTFPDEVDFRMDDFLGSSLYQDNIDIYFSPLGKNAFSYYNYIYEGFDYDGQYTVNKIRVKPKRGGKQFFDGYLYIIENLWCLHRADLNFDTPFGKVNVRQVYDEVRPQVWLPVGYNYSFNGGMIGLKANAKFGASVQYNNLELNKQVLAMANYPAARETEESVGQPQPARQPVSKSSSKRSSKINELLEKDKLNNQEMGKLSRMMAKKDAESKPDTARTLEVKDNLQVKVDSDARKRDTAYWQQIRPIPLSEEELKSFQKRDSIQVVKKALMAQDSNALKVHKRNYGFFNPLFFGTRRTLNDSTWQFSYSGLINISKISFNAVDGLLVNQEASFSKTFAPGRSLRLIPQAAYAFHRKSLMVGGVVALSYAPEKRGILQLSGGKYGFDFKSEPQQLNPFVNSIATLFFKENYARYYESRQIKIENQIDIANGVVLTAGLGWRDLRRLENSTHFSFYQKDDPFPVNRPENPELTDKHINNQISSTLNIKIEYTPRYFYRMKEGVKEMVNSKYPTFYIQYRKGIPDLFSSVSDYDYLGGGFTYGYKLYTSSTLSAELHGGWFPNNRQVHFSEFEHAPTQPSPVMLKEYRNTFYNAGYYRLSTSDRFVRGHLSYKAPYIILKYLPVLRNTLWREMIWAGYYGSPANPNHIEVGYKLLEVFLSANIGVYACWDDGRFKGVGFNLSFMISNQ